MVAILVSLLSTFAHAAVLSGDSVPVVSLGADVKTGARCVAGDRDQIRIPVQVIYEMKVEKKEAGWAELSVEMNVIDQVQSISAPKKIADSKCGEYISEITMGAVYKIAWKVKDGAALQSIKSASMREDGVNRASEFAQVVSTEVAKLKQDVRGFSVQMTGTSSADLFSAAFEFALAAYRERALTDLNLRQVIRVRTEQAL
jgi:hypothetical protein